MEAGPVVAARQAKNTNKKLKQRATKVGCARGQPSSGASRADAAEECVEDEAEADAEAEAAQLAEEAEAVRAAVRAAERAHVGTEEEDEIRCRNS